MQRVNRPSKAFTLTELLLAVLVLLVVIAATARIFGTAQRVSSVGEANASILQDAGAIERRLRDDLARMSDKGYMAIRNFAVRNDINDDPTTSGQKELLNPELADDAILRLDQLVFFTEGATQTVDLIGGANLSAIDPTTNRRVVGYMPSSVVSRVTYGHGVQVGNRTAQSNPASQLYDPDFYLENEQKWLSPWLVDRVPNGPGL
jgi:type II secretory pathway pseudopilin PulG